jgi:hypothetical protein
MLSARKNQVRQAKLPNAPQTLELRSVHKGKDKLALGTVEHYQVVHRVADDLDFVSHIGLPVAILTVC